MDIPKRCLLCTAIVTVVVMSGCSDGAETVRPAPEASPLEGVWSAPAYGQLYRFDRTDSGYTSSQYYVTRDSCLPGETLDNLTVADLDAVTRMTENPDKIEIHRSGEVVAAGVGYQRLESLPELCTGSLLAVKGEAGFVFDPQRDFQIFWDTFNELYFDFALSGTDWQAVYSAAELELPNIDTEEELFQLFADMITPLQDGHNELVRGDLTNGVEALLESDGEFETFSVSHKPDHTDRLLTEFVASNALTLPLTDEELDEFDIFLEAWEVDSEAIILSYASTPVEAAADDQFVWFNTNDNIGYLFIGAMAGFGDSEFDITTDVTLAKAALDSIVADMQGTNGLIIDLRFNNGGEDEVSLAIASYFTAHSTHVYSKQARLGGGRTELVDVFVDPTGNVQYLAPIVLLTSTTTGSAAESFALSMRMLPYVTIAGEPTAGRLSNQLVSRVTASIAFSLSNEFYFSPAGDWFERVGIPVDHAVPFWTQELHAQGRDPGIEKALELLSQ